MGKRRAGVLALLALVALAAVGWIAGSSIKSPAQVAADTAPPPASPITVPVVKQKLQTTVQVRGNVAYGSPQSVVLGVSKVKQGSDIVTRAPRSRAELKTGSLVMMVDGRPVFALPGSVPMHRDLYPGASGPDVRQLERALVQMGFHPGQVDGHFDAATAAAVSAWYLRRGWNPFGATDTQLEQLQAARANAAAARDAQLQALNNVVQARRAGSTDVATARLDAVSARKDLDQANLDLATAKSRLANAEEAAGVSGAVQQAQAEAQRDQALADAEVANKRLAYNQAVNEQRAASINADSTPSDASQADREAAAARVREAADNVKKSQADLDAAIDAANTQRIAGRNAIAKARNDASASNRDLRLARAEQRRAQLAVQTARRTARLAGEKVRLVTTADVHSLQAIADAAADEARRTSSEVARLARRAGIQVPANEVLFFPTLPRRVGQVSAKRGTIVQGPVMKATNSRLTVESSVSNADVRLLQVGNPVVIEDPEMNLKAPGTVTQVSTLPGTRGVDPDRFYVAVTPNRGLFTRVGTNVKLSIQVHTTRGDVLAVPPTALSIGGDGNSRIQVRRNGRIELVLVNPGVKAEGLVEVRPVGNSKLAPGDLVVVGTRTPANGQFTASSGGP